MYDQLIRKITSYTPLSEAVLPQIDALFERKVLLKNDFFLREGQICRELGFISKGLVCYYVNSGGNDVVHNFARENDFICNYDSFINRSASQKNILALEHTELLVISFDNLQRFYKIIPGGERFGRLLMEEVYVQAIKHIISFYTDSPEQRYSEFVAQHNELLQRIPQYHIAAYIGVKPPSLSRIRKRMLNS